MRVALGAGNGRLFRQHLIEGLLLTTIGAIAGSWWRVGASTPCWRWRRRV